jgi:FKBP-type peptidyl-prolyl cis-trans isomerase (trigger factor)
MATHHNLPVQKTDTVSSSTVSILHHRVVREENKERVLISIIVPVSVVSLLFEQAAATQQKLIKAAGFDYGEVPLAFIKQQYKNSLLDHLKEFLLKFCVINYLYKTIRTERLVVAGDPQILTIYITPDSDASFTFVGITPNTFGIQEWRYLPFRAPKRKNYKDLDRQAENFINEEAANQANTLDGGIQKNDWVCLALTIVAENEVPLFENFEQYFWVTISDEKVDNPLRDFLIGRRLHEMMVTQSTSLQEYFSEQLETDYRFVVRIVSHIPYAYVCFEQLKNNFKLKTKKELLKKLIEVFSYRNDISQRRATVEDCLSLLLHKHPFSVPEEAISCFKEMLLRSMHESPDYNVYRTQKEFYALIHRLAEKIARETALLDTLAYHEKLHIERADIEGYLNCTKRLRTKEFIYCKISVPQYEGQSTLISEEELMHICLREKTINHVLYHLTKE